jgi:hypothetical protein
MRFLYVSIVTLACVGFAAHPGRAADALTGEMAGYNFLLGGPWTCTSNVPSIMGMPARTDTLTGTFDVVPRNVLHATFASADFHGDEYFGFSKRFNNYWSAEADSHAIHGFAMSVDGKTFTGTSYLGTGSMSDVSTYTKLSPTQTAMREVLSGNGNSFTIETTCRR